MCVNPAHLWLGTNKDNIGDKVSKGRSALPMIRGERHKLSKLTSDKVLRIRELYASGGVSQQRLGVQFDTATTNISAVVRRLTWKYI